MADQPWFKFYAADYLLDPHVDAMPREAEALLVRMWCICHREGSCPADPETLARKTLCNLPYVVQWKSNCEAFFELRDGKLYSRRMEAEKQRSETARKNANERWKLNPKSKSERGNADSIATSKANPTLAEVTAYCQERHNQVDPDKWFDYYSSNGWKVGRNSMKDWRASIRLWERNGSTNAPNGRSSTAASPSSLIERHWMSLGLDPKTGEKLP